MTDGERALEPLREKIDEIDAELLFLLRKRFDVTDQVAQVKKQYALTERDYEREEFQFNRIAQIASSVGIDSEFAKKVLSLVIGHVLERYKTNGRTSNSSQ